MMTFKHAARALRRHETATGPRPGLCQTIGTHDLGPNRTCRDCGKPLTDKDLVAATCLLDELPGRRL